MNDGKVTTNGEEIRGFYFKSGIDCPFRIIQNGLGVRLEIKGVYDGVMEINFFEDEDFEYFLSTIRSAYYELKERFTMKGDDE